MTLILVLLVVVLVCGGGFFYAPGPWNATGQPAPPYIPSLLGIILIVCVVLFLAGRI